jgi:peptide/nickel transport system substrate-binding protein
VEGLVEIDAEGKYVPVLAEALPEVSEDGLVVTYKLKPGIKFSNGDPFTCADVVYTWNALLSDLSQASTSGYGDIDSIDCPDDATVVVNFAELYAPYLRLFSFILPQAAGDPASLDSWEYNRAPIGTGPWVVQEWKAGDQIVYAKNPNYREAPEKPYLDGVIVKILPSREVGMQLLGTGEIHALWDLIEADFAALDAMKDQGVGYASAVTGENELLVFNLADPAVDAPADPAASPHPILSDVRVREAIQMAIDKALIVETLLNGQVKVGTTVLPVGQFACPGIDPDSHLFGNYHSARIPTAENEGAGNNYSRWINADVDQWIDDAAGVTDVAARQALYCQVAEQINKDLPRVFLYERLLITGVRDEVQNFAVSPGPRDFTTGSADWWIQK